MTLRTPITRNALRRLTWPLRLTRAGLVAERAARSFWPAWVVVAAVVSAHAMGAADGLGAAAARWTMAGAGVTLVATLAVWGRNFRWPTRAEAMARLDATLPGRPIATLLDTQAIGQKDSASAFVWLAHQERMAASLAGTRPAMPDLRLSDRDPLALRYTVLTALVIAVMFGQFGRPGSVAGQPDSAQAATGPSWEIWLEPPRYTGKPSLYLNTLDSDALTVPQGTQVTVRLYGTADDIGLQQTVSAASQPDAAPASPVRAFDFAATQSGMLSITGEGARDWRVTVTPDAPPTVDFAGPIGRDGDGSFGLPFTARDDYAVVRGRAEIALDLDLLARRHGLATAPDDLPPLVIDLPMPFTGNRAEFTETLADDASRHVFANLPVRMTLHVEDAAGQVGTSGPQQLVLPGRRFFDPMAAALVELRRDLLWSRANGQRTMQILRAITHRPEGFMVNERAYLMLRVAMRRLESGLDSGTLAPEARDEVAEALWEIAVLLEDGGLSDALDRMRQAQERLSEAIRNGASPEEIERLMQDLRQATDDYIRKLAENARPEPGADEPERQADAGQEITGDQIQQMMDEIQRLMEEGRMAEAQELLEQFNRMMQNLQVTQGKGGEGQQSPGGQAMRDLQDTLRGQQDLSDDAFQRLQNNGINGNQGQPEPGAPEAGQPGEQPRAGVGGGDQRSLAERQRDLRDQLADQQGRLPDTGGSDLDEAAREALRQAEEAMGQAERALRDGDMAGALDQQADAIRNLREGLRNLGEALAQNQRNQTGDQGQADAEGQREVPRDPLGRTAGSLGSVDSDKNMLPGQDAQSRARSLMDEIRRRSDDLGRPRLELDYLRRLLDRF